MMESTVSKEWEWVDGVYGPMGWFSDTQKQALEGNPEFENGEWREVTAEELADFRRWLTAMAYAQS